MQLHQVLHQILHRHCACTFACGCNAITIDLELMSRVIARHVYARMLRASRFRYSAVDVESNSAIAIMHHSLFDSLRLQVINVQQVKALCANNQSHELQSI